MKAFVRVAGLASILVVLHGCAPYAPAPTTTSKPYPPPTTQPPPPAKPPVSEPIKPAPSPAPTAQSPAAGLIKQGWVMFQQQNFQGALSTAERAQRIDARNPEVYLLMARAQLALYQVSSAEQVARKGLSLSQAGTSINRQLQALLTQITGL
jgi:hypothetical protein